MRHGSGRGSHGALAFAWRAVGGPHLPKRPWPVRVITAEVTGSPAFRTSPCALPGSRRSRRAGRDRPTQMAQLARGRLVRRLALGAQLTCTREDRVYQRALGARITAHLLPVPRRELALELLVGHPVVRGGSQAVPERPGSGRPVGTVAKTWTWTLSSGVRNMRWPGSRTRSTYPAPSRRPTNTPSSLMSGTVTRMSTIGLATRPGTEVEPMCSTRRATLPNA
jgi:hypothetical protein